MQRRLLMPAEAMLLLAPAAGSASKCIQAGLLSLLGDGRIKVEQSSNPFKQLALLLVSPGPGTGNLLPGHLAALERALAEYGKGNRLVSSQVIHALQKRFGLGYGRYVHNEVAPGLIKRGLLTRSDSKWLGLFPRIQYQRTPRGDALAEPLKRLMIAVETVPSLVTKDPEQALRLARSAGVLLIMSPEARRQIPKLRKLLAERGEDLEPLAYLPIDSDREPEWEHVLEIGDMALAFELDTLLDGIDAVGDFTSGGDSSSSDGGCDGGGD